MRYGFALGIASLLSIAITTVLPQSVKLAGSGPDLLLLFVIFNGMFTGSTKGAAGGFALGLLQDLYLGRFIGLHALSKMLVGFMAGRLTKSIFKENLWVPVLNTIWGTFTNLAVVFLVGRLVGNTWPFVLALKQGLFELIYNICLVPFLYGPYYFMAERLLVYGRKQDG